MSSAGMIKYEVLSQYIFKYVIYIYIFQTKFLYLNS